MRSPMILIPQSLMMYIYDASDPQNHVHSTVLHSKSNSIKKSGRSSLIINGYAGYNHPGSVGSYDRVGAGLHLTSYTQKSSTSQTRRRCKTLPEFQGPSRTKRFLTITHKSSPRITCIDQVLPERDCIRQVWWHCGDGQHGR